MYRTPEERFAGLPDFPFEPHYVEIEGLRMHYVEEGRGDPLLLLHGEPTWSFLYRKMIPALRGRFRCVAPDYIGFGRSDKWTDVGAYSFARHVADLERFAEALDLRRITLVVQNWSGPLGLHYAVPHHDRVARLVILNTGLLSGEAVTLSPGLVKWREYARRTPDLPIGQIIRRAVVERASLTATPSWPPTTRPFQHRNPRRALARFRHSSRPDLMRRAAPRCARLAPLAWWDKPALVCFSDSDPVFPPAVGHALAALIPGSRFSLICCAGHFLQEEKGLEIAQEILAFVPD